MQIFFRKKSLFFQHCRKNCICQLNGSVYGDSQTGYAYQRKYVIQQHWFVINSAVKHRFFRIGGVDKALRFLPRRIFFDDPAHCMRPHVGFVPVKKTVPAAFKVFSFIFIGINNINAHRSAGLAGAG